MIAFDTLTARYPSAAAPAVRDVSLEVRPGFVTAVVGPNGSGKSTLVRALLGRVPIIAGRVLLDDVDVATLPRRDIAKRLAVVVQREEPVFPMSVQEYVALGRFPHATAWSASPDDSSSVAAAAREAGVGELLARRTDSLSGGEWQRVRIARALAQRTSALALDEPTTFLDIAHEMSTFELLATLARAGRAVLVVSHQLNLVARFAAHVALLHHGRLVAQGTPDEVMRASILEAVYEWPLVVARDPAVGAPTLVPLRRRGGTPRW